PTEGIDYSCHIIDLFIEISKVLRPGDKHFDELREACEEVFFSVGPTIDRRYGLSSYYTQVGAEVVVLEYKRPFYVERIGVDWVSDISEEQNKPFFVLGVGPFEVLHLGTRGFEINKDLLEIMDISREVWGEPRPNERYYKLGPRDEHGNRAWVPKELESITIWKKKKGKVLTPGDKYFDELRQACEEVFFSVGGPIKRGFPYSIYYIRAGFEVVVLEYKEQFYVEGPGVDWISEGDKRPFFVLEEGPPDVLHLSMGGFVIHRDLSEIRETVKKIWEEDP
ncbi:MAG: hypothetical protein QME54_07130, partial [Actinomycetota bacterium]|nr:hypothetical protein [Actinomycetota bacterium]